MRVGIDLQNPFSNQRRKGRAVDLFLEKLYRIFKRVF